MSNSILVLEKYSTNFAYKLWIKHEDIWTGNLVQFMFNIQ